MPVRWREARFAAVFDLSLNPGRGLGLDLVRWTPLVIPKHSDGAGQSDGGKRNANHSTAEHCVTLSRRGVHRQARPHASPTSYNRKLWMKRNGDVPSGDV
jgi:hypothetical protein